MSKAQIVVDTYDETRAKNESPLACYHAAWGATKYQGGIEIWNSNNGPISVISSAPNQIFKFPNQIFEFDDGSSVSVTYGGAHILTEVDSDDKS